MKFSIAVDNGGNRTKPLGVGSEFSLLGNGDSLFVTDDCVAHELKRCRVQRITSWGIVIDGMEEVGVDKTGRKKYRYREWFIRFVEGHPRSDEGETAWAMRD